MSTSHGTGITWAEFYGFLTGPAGCREVSWTPGTHVTLRQPNGREFTTCKPEKTGEVSLKHFAATAREFNKNATEMFVWMGRKPPGKSKMTAKRADRKVVEKRKNEAPAYVDELAPRIKAQADAIYRSGACRKASPAQRAELERITRRLEQWHLAIQNEAAV